MRFSCALRQNLMLHLTVRIPSPFISRSAICSTRLAGLPMFCIFSISISARLRRALLSKYELATSIAMAGGKPYSLPIDSLPRGKVPAGRMRVALEGKVYPHPGLPVRFTAGTGRRPSLPYAVHYVFAWQNGSSTRRGLKNQPSLGGTVVVGQVIVLEEVA